MDPRGPRGGGDDLVSSVPLRVLRGKISHRPMRLRTESGDRDGPGWCRRRSSKRVSSGFPTPVGMENKFQDWVLGVVVTGFTQGYTENTLSEMTDHSDPHLRPTVGSRVRRIRGQRSLPSRGFYVSPLQELGLDYFRVGRKRLLIFILPLVT